MRLLARSALAGVLALAASTATAAPTPVFPQTVPTNSLACANYGDFVSCSAQYLNFLLTGDPDGNGSVDFVDHRPQGALFDPLVIQVGGGPGQASNAEYGANVDNAYGPNGSGSVDEYGTHLDGNASGSDPTPAVTGETQGPLSNLTAWDIGLSNLIAALTHPDGRHDLYIMFDNNQAGQNLEQSILVWSLACVRSSTGALGDVCFELIDQNGDGNPLNNVDPTLFSTAKTYGTAPAAAEFVRANGAFCVDNITGQAVSANQSNCPAGTTLINNNLGTNETEFIVQIPELNANLESYLALGYDMLSVQYRFDDNTNGFEDIYVLAGPLSVNEVPEPGMLLTVAMALIGFYVTARGTRRS